MNKIWLLGRLTADPVLSYTSSQMPVCKFNLAVDRKRSGNNGEQETDFFRIVSFGKAAETHNRYLTKGRQISLEGHVQTGSYKNKEGRTVYTTDVIADSIEYLAGGAKKSSERNQQQNQNDSYEDTTYESEYEQQSMYDDAFEEAEDIPF